MTSVRDHQYARTSAIVALAAVVFAVPAMAQMPASLTEAPEFPAETAAIVAATSAFFDEIEAARLPESKRPVIARPSIATPASAGRGDEKAGVLTTRGPVDHLTGYRLSWYPVDRFLGSVDFMGTWDGNRNLVCGFVTWDLSDPDAPVLDEVTATFLDVSDLSKGSEEDIHAALLDGNCAYGAIEANYAFFE
jgi:hypothetical protein